MRHPESSCYPSSVPRAQAYFWRVPLTWSSVSTPSVLIKLIGQVVFTCPVKLCCAGFLPFQRRHFQVSCILKIRPSMCCRSVFSVFDIIHGLGGRNPILFRYVVNRCLHSLRVVLRE